MLLIFYNDWDRVLHGMNVQQVASELFVTLAHSMGDGGSDICSGSVDETTNLRLGAWRGREVLESGKGEVMSIQNIKELKTNSNNTFHGFCE